MAIINAVIIHAPAIEVAAWLVERFHAAGRAKKMRRLAAAETVAGEIVFARQQGEIAMGDDQMQIAGCGADRTIAIEQFGCGSAPRPKADCTTMTPAFNRLCQISLPLPSFSCG